MIRIAFAMAAALAISPALAHDAPSGWEYPATCCAGKDCRPTDCGLVHTRPDGGANWIDLHFEREQIKMSGDAQCHVCIGYTEVPRRARFPHCLFLAPTN